VLQAVRAVPPARTVVGGTPIFVGSSATVCVARSEDRSRFSELTFVRPETRQGRDSPRSDWDARRLPSRAWETTVRYRLGVVVAELRRMSRHKASNPWTHAATTGRLMQQIEASVEARLAARACKPQGQATVSPKNSSARLLGAVE
jgi:hypothetical protein